MEEDDGIQDLHRQISTPLLPSSISTVDPSSSQKEKLENSPIEQVALTVPIEDERTATVATARMWVLGTASCALLSFLNQFFAYRKEPLTITSVSAQIAVLPVARMMAARLPNRSFFKGSGCEFSLNPGPFSVKEHVLITIFANAGAGNVYAIHIVSAVRVFYRQRISFFVALLVVLTTQVLGFGWAGIFRRYLVEPAAMWWPQNIVQVSLFSIMGKPKEGGIQASWESGEVMLFCDLCIKEIGLGNRPTTHFSKEGWTNLIAGFKERTGKSYDRLQMKNKWDHLKKDWKLWKELKHGETGLGWDPEKRTIAASEEWWADKIKVVPAAKKFRSGGISPDLEEKLDSMFSQVVATGEASWAPSIGSLPPDVGGIMLDEDDVADNLENEEMAPEEMGLASTPPGNASSSVNKRRKLGKNRGMAFSLMSELHHSTLAVKPPPVVTVKEVVELLSTYSELMANLELYYFALEHIRDKTTREIFMSIPEHMRVWWIMKAYEKRDQ